MKQHAPRTIAVVIGSVALIAAAFGAGYRAGVPTALRAPANPKEFVSAVRTALTKPSQLEGAADLAPVLASVGAQDLDAIVGTYEASFISVGAREVAMQLLAEAWSKIDPAGAFERIDGWRPYRRKLTLPFLMRSWARQDLLSARKALTKIEPKPLQETATTAVILGWYDAQGPGMWDAYVAGQPFGSKAANDVIRRIGAREGTDALLRRVASLPADADAHFRVLALRRAVDFAAQSDPERAAAFAEAHRRSASGLEGIVAMRWGRTDGPRAAQWALSRPPGHARERSLRSAFESWLRSDEAAALAWAQHQPDEVVAAFRFPYARAIARTDPQRALEMSTKIADPKDRRRLQGRVARSWLAKQPKIAAAWLKKNDLGDLIAAARRRESSRARLPRKAAGPPGAEKDE